MSKAYESNGVAPLIHYQLLPVCQDNGPLRHGHASMIVGNSQIVRNIEIMWVNHSQMGGLIWFYHVLPTLMRRYGEFLKVWSSPARTSKAKAKPKVAPTRAPNRPSARASAPSRAQAGDVGTTWLSRFQTIRWLFQTLTLINLQHQSWLVLTYTHLAFWNIKNMSMYGITLALYIIYININYIYIYAHLDR